MSRYYEIAQGIITGHGGTVEKFVGDAVMAVFGMPVAHEDDPLRAARSAVELRDAIRALGEELRQTWPLEIELRLGITTGEVMAAPTDEAHSLVTGDAVNTAARLEAAADPGEILIGSMTEQLIRQAARTESVSPLELKGKRDPVPAFRLLGLSDGEAMRRRPDLPLIGRVAELGRLQDAFERVIVDQRCHIATVVGPAGIGKSRLVGEFLAALPDVTVARGRCLPYGRGITYRPLAEALFALAGIVADDGPASARTKLDRLAGGLEHETLISDRVASLIGLGPAGPPPEEMTWAVRRLLAHVARNRPLVLTIDDIQWAEPSLLDLFEQIAELTSDAPILLLTMARPEILEWRSAWRSAAAVIELEPLPPADAELQLTAVLASQQVSEDLRRRVLEAADGNPLFVEQFAEMLADRQGSDRLDDQQIGVPPSIQALLAARLDQLPGPEQHLLERAAIIGRVFWWGAVARLSTDDERPAVGSAISALVRRRLLRSDVSTFVGDEAFRFHHLVLRDVAYGRLPKRSRADLHELFAAWLDEKTGDRRVEYEEIIAHHLFEAFTNFRAVGDLPAAQRAADQAAVLLRAAGERALARRDLAAAIYLLQRAMELPARDVEERLAPAADVVWALGETGQTDAALDLLHRSLQELDTQAPGSDMHRYLELVECELGMFVSGEGSSQCRQVLDEVIREFGRAGNHEGLARAWSVRVLEHWLAMEVSAAEHAAAIALEHAAKADKLHLGKRFGVAGGEVYGLAPVEPTIKKLRAALAIADAVDQLPILFGLIGLEAMAGRIDRARAAHVDAEELAREYGHRIGVGLGEMIGKAELIAGTPERAEAALRASIDRLRPLGIGPWLGFQLGNLAEALARQGKLDEALSAATEVADMSDPNDSPNWFLVHQARALVLLAKGEAALACAEAEKGLARVDGTEFISWIGDGRMVLARARAASGDRRGAMQEAIEAEQLYAAKGNVVGEAAASQLRRSLGDID